MKTFASSNYHARAIVLRVRNLGEKDRVMTLLSQERGKFDATARGARRPKAKLGAVSQPFMLARFLISKGRSIDLATQAQIEDAHLYIAGDLLKTAWASYCCEMATLVPEHLPEEELFHLLRDALAAFNEPVVPIEDIGRWYEARYLALLGYAPQIGRCVACDKKLTVPTEDVVRRLLYSPALGGTLCGDCSLRDASRLSVNVQALRALHRLSRNALPVDLALGAAARRELRDCLRRSITVHLETRLKSATFLDEVSADLSEPAAEKPPIA